MKKLSTLGFFALLIGLVSCKSTQNLPQTKSDLKENLKTERVKYSYDIEKFDGEGIVINIPMGMDSTDFKFYITEALNALLDNPIPKKFGIHREEYEGYRIQIYRGRSKNQAVKARRRSYEIFPHLRPYMEYRSPTYRVKVGDFLERYEYVKVFKRLKREFPSAMIVPSIVTVTVDYGDK